MTLDQLRQFANSSDGWVTQIALTKSAARQLLAEHEREVGRQEPGFEPRERDDSKHAASMFARFATAEADYQRACTKLRRGV